MNAADPARSRVFCIGLNKTGTTSFHQAMGLLGYESLHWGGPETRKLVETALAEGRPLLHYVDPRYDVFSDVEVLSRNFALLDEQYPGSRFVLTVRPVEDWIDSRRRHEERMSARKARGEYDGNLLEIDEPAWRNLWERHVAAARDYFAGRDDFLEIDVTCGAGWEPFCTLLGREIPDVEFPWVNRSADADAWVFESGAAGLAGRLRRRLARRSHSRGASP